MATFIVLLSWQWPLDVSVTWRVSLFEVPLNALVLMDLFMDLTDLPFGQPCSVFQAMVRPSSGVYKHELEGIESHIVLPPPPLTHPHSSLFSGEN